MNESNYTPNSNRYRQEQKNKDERKKKFDKIVSGPVKVRKKSKFAELFLSEDIASLRSYILTDMVIPKAKTFILELVDVFLNGSSGRSSFRSGTRAGQISYIDYSSRSRGYSAPPTDNGNRNRTAYAYEDIVVPTKADAEEVLTRLDEAIESYGMVSIADLYDLVGKTADYTDDKYGWKNLRSAESVRVSDGYWIKLPRAIPLD